MELKRSMHARAARLLAMLAMALVCALVVAPSAYADAAVARIDETGLEYNTFDEAVAAAENNQTVTLLGNAETTGLNLSKDLTIDGEGKFALNFTDKGIALWGHALVLKNVNASMTGIGSTPYTAEWNWMAVGASKGASLTLDGATLSMDGTGAGNVHAIYFCSNNKLNLKNGSNLTIKNYKQDALEWDGGDGGYNVNIETGSTYTSDHCRSGFTGTFVVTVDKSKVNVVNSTGNGSNGSTSISRTALPSISLATVATVFLPAISPLTVQRLPPTTMLITASSLRVRANSRARTSRFPVPRVHSTGTLACVC